MDKLDSILTAPADQGRYWLVVKADGGGVGVVPLCLEGHESQKVATSRFEDACVVSRVAIGKRGGWNPCNYHVDGKPRTEFELACDAYMKKVAEIGVDNLGPGKIALESLPEYEAMVALQPARDDPSWKEI
jgi:hypothetical protein